MKNHALVCVTGGIAAYKAAVVVRGLMKNGWQVKVAMTKTATKFVTPLTFASLTNHSVAEDSNWQNDHVAHVKLARWADVVVVVPATANIIAKIANGIADDFVSTTILAATAPKLIVPAMNDGMWQNEATKANVKTLAARQINVMMPASGMLAEGYAAVGRMPEPEAVVAWINAQFIPKPKLANKKVVITAGPTVEAIDPVRYLANRSSGKMGYALAQAAKARDAEVVLISGPTKLMPPAGVEVINVTSAREMQAKLREQFTTCDVCVMAAAVADYRIKHYANQKLKRKANQDLLLELTPNPDIVAGLGKIKTHQLLVGFAAETNDVLTNGAKKLHQKKLDMLVANDVSRNDIGFGSDDNQIALLLKNKTIFQPKMEKSAVAGVILDTLAAEFL